MEIGPNVEALLHQFISDELARPKSIDAITASESLIEKGIIDSLGIVNLVVYIEETFGFKVKDEDIVPEYFESINSIAGYIGRMVGLEKAGE
jgi:acyl carrier protein